MRFGILVFVASLTGCSLAFKDAPQACKTTMDCSVMRPDLALVCSQGLCLAAEQAADPREEQWGCTALPARTPDPRLKHTLRIPVVGILDQKPIAGVKVRLCGSFDVGCQFDASDPATSQLSDAQGLTSFEVADGFSGFLLYEKTDYLSGIYMMQDVNVLRVQRFAEGDPLVRTYSLFKPTDLALVTSLVSGNSYNPAEASIFMFFENCQRQPAAGVRGLLDRLGSTTIEYYYIGSLPSATVGATDSSGQGGFINVPPGVSTLSVRLLGETSDLGKTTLVTRAGHLTVGDFLPGQRPDLAAN